MRDHVSSFYGKTLLLAGLAGLCCSLAVHSEEPSASRPNYSSPMNGTRRTQRRLRQGTELSKVQGQFRLAGDRVSFYPGEMEVKEITVLENLALERVISLVGEGTRHEWVVSGTITEFRGKNYLLLTRAVIASKPIKPKRSP